MAVTALVDEVLRVVSTALDAAFYRAVYGDVARAGIDPIRHYLTQGWREGRDPAPWFSSSAYLSANTDVRRAGVEPLYHYLTQGRREGREVVPSAQGEAYLFGELRAGEVAAWSLDALLRPTPPVVRTPPPAAPAALVAPPPVATAPEEPEPAPSAPPLDPSMVAEQDRAEVAAEFDADYYLGAYPDVADAGVDPLSHFMTTGWREGRDPTARFSVNDYLENYPDIAIAGINPFLHYVRAGRAEGRSPRNELGFRYGVIAALQPVTERVAAIAASEQSVKVGAADDLATALLTSRTGLADLHVTFSHDDYSANFGGVQLSLQREDARISELGRDHLHLYPIKPWPVMRVAGEAASLGVLWNGARVGAFSAGSIAKTLKAAVDGVAPGQRSFAIHSLLGHSADETLEILAAVGLKAGYFWLHDFASLCAGFHLLRNDVQDCAAPPIDSPACSICSYLPFRRRHLDAHAQLFAALDLTVVSPSEPTLALWRASSSYPAKDAVILPHAELVVRGPSPVSRKKRPLRVAFLGLPAMHKGWGVFRDLVLKYADDPRYAFLHLGGRSGGLPAEFHHVVVGEANPRLMQETLEKLEADVVLLWPLCRETFSFAAYEAVAAGCAVVTGPDSGNIAAFVRDGAHGRVMADEAALDAAFADGAIADLARARRKPKLYDLKFSALTVDLLVGQG